MKIKERGDYDDSCTSTVICCLIAFTQSVPYAAVI